MVSNDPKTCGVVGGGPQGRMCMTKNILLYVDALYGICCGLCPVFLKASLWAMPSVYQNFVVGHAYF